MSTIDKIAAYRRAHGVSLAEARRIVCAPEEAEKASARKGSPHALTLPLATETLGHSIRVVNADGDDVALIGDAGPEARKAADLFAAAPEMLEASKALLAILTKRVAGAPGSVIDARERLAAAIAKAEGRS